MTHRLENLPDEILYEVCVRVLRLRQKATVIRDWLWSLGYASATRESPRDLLAQAMERGLLVLNPREDVELAMRIVRHSAVVTRVAMVADDWELAFQQVAKLAAEQVLTLIRNVHRAGQRQHPARQEVHIGLAAGGTSTAFAYHLARLLEHEPEVPQLVLHSLTSGFFVEDPDSAPNAALREFRKIKPTPRYVALYSSPLIEPKELDRLKTQPFTRDAFEAAPQIDIVVTSISVAHHAHSLFKHAIEKENPSLAAKRFRHLDARRWAGDIMWRPYSTEGEPIESEVEAVSVVGFRDLVAISRAEDKHVVCIAGPCASCGEVKTDALIPLLKCRSGRRPFNHLITTSTSARAVCEEFGWKAP